MGGGDGGGFLCIVLKKMAVDFVLDFQRYGNGQAPLKKRIIKKGGADRPIMAENPKSRKGDGPAGKIPQPKVDQAVGVTFDPVDLGDNFLRANTLISRWYLGQTRDSNPVLYHRK